MPAPKFLLALAAIGAGVASAKTCDKDVKIKSVGDAKIDCDTVKGDVIFENSGDLSGAIDISGPDTIEGDLIIKNASSIQALSSSSIEKIGGKFQLQSMESLNSINFGSLEEVGEIEWITLTALESVKFGTDGVTTVESVRISDTVLSSLDGLNMASVGTFSIDNNAFLTNWETRLTNITKKLSVADNSDELEVSFPRLTDARDIDVRGVKSLSVPLLKELTGSFLLTENDGLESFIAPNLTKTGESVSLRNNDKLSNVSFPVLERTGGSLTVQNNQELVDIDGFPELERVDGSVTMRGNFTDIELPSLSDVQGALDIQSTEDIEEACKAFKDLGKRIQGKFDCEGKNEKANEGGKSDNSGSDDDEDAGAFLGANAPLVLGVAAIGGLLQLL